MNPLREDLFWKYWGDVNGLEDWDFDRFTSFDPTGLPDYIAAVKNGSRRVLRLQKEWVAIPLFKIVGRSPSGGYRCRFGSEAELRKHFMIAEGTRIMAIGVDHDNRLERFWQEHRSSGVIDQLRHLGLDAVTAPNFSLFTDSNRFQHLRNQKRMLLVCERFSAVGIVVIPHLNAHNENDWAFWSDLLRHHSEITTVCKEFQTGSKDRIRGTLSIESLAKLRERCGRNIHCILVGGSAFYPVAKTLLGGSFTVTDSRPFMLALSRRLLSRTADGSFIEAQCRTAPGQGVDHILHHNIVAHVEQMRTSSVVKSSEKKEACQGDLDFSISTPNLMSQPAA
jgi:hypothetical protein